MNRINSIGTGPGGEVKTNRTDDGELSVHLHYVSVSDVSPGTQIRDYSHVTRTGKTVPAGRPSAVVTGPKPSDGVWNLAGGGTLDLSDGQGNALDDDYFVLLGEVTRAEAETILGRSIPRGLTRRTRRV